jgi:murein DD-endopeptidase MepM/ murein hydrolase activator NlpD
MNAARIVRKTPVLIRKPQLLQIRHMEEAKPVSEQLEKTKISFDVFKKMKNSPNVDVSLEPKDGNFLVFHPTPGFTSAETPLAQLSVLALIHNKGTMDIDLDKVVLEYKKGAITVKKSINLPSDKLIIEPGKIRGWQNNREYHETGDVVYLTSPYPKTLTVSLHFKGFADPVQVVKNLKPYTQGFALPFKEKDLRTDEHYSGYSMHGGGAQVFAYDFGAMGYDDKAWRDSLPGKDGTANNHYRIWGKNIYAMADGEVIHFLNDCPNNPKPDGSKAGMKKQKDDLWGSFDHGGAGNHFYIRHGNVVALYAHMQKNSLTSKFLKKGAKVKKGDLLGKAGNSGNSSAPHLHVHIKSYVSDDKPENGYYRPLLFNNGYVIGMAKYTEPKSNVNWAGLQTQGVPGLKGKSCFIWPSATHLYCAYPTNWGEVCRFGVIAGKYQEEIDKIWTCGYYPVWVDAYDFGANTYFSAIFRPSKGIQWVARHNLTGAQYQAEYNKWDKAGYRLINVNSYLLKGGVRYAAVWIKNKSVLTFAYHGKSLAWHEAKFKEVSKKGWAPVNVSCVVSGGQIFVTALWEKKNTGGFYLRPVMTLPEYKAAFKQFTDKEKFKLVYLDAYVYKGKPMLSGIWYRQAPNYTSWWAKHYRNTGQFQAEYNAHLKKGFLTRCIAGYHDKGAQRYEGVWSK